MGKKDFWLGKGADTDSRQERKTSLTSNQFEVSEDYMNHLEDESKENNIDNQQEKQYLAFKKEEEEEPRGSNMDRVPGIVRKVAVKSEEVDDPRIHKMYDPRIQRMHREDLSEEGEESESTE